jgi:hypothetical protein
VSITHRPYRDPATVERDEGPRPSALERVGALQTVHAPPPLHRALIAPVLLAVLVEGVGVAASGPVWLVTVFALVILGVLAQGPLRLRGVSVELHANGVVVCRRGDRQAVVFEDVNEVWFEVDTVQGRSGASLQGIRLRDYEGRTHHVPVGLVGAPTVVGAILRACSQPLVAEARRALDEGEPLTFGRVRLDREAIHVRGKRLPWSEAKLMVVSHAKVRIYRRFPLFAWCTVRLDAIPHPTVFVALAAARAGRVRVDDAILVPFATSAEANAALAAQGPEVALRHMLYGGILFFAGVLITVVSYLANARSYFLAYGPIIAGAMWFARGLAAYRSGNGR